MEPALSEKGARNEHSSCTFTYIKHHNRGANEMYSNATSVTCILDSQSNAIIDTIVQSNDLKA